MTHSKHNRKGVVAEIDQPEVKKQSAADLVLYVILAGEKRAREKAVIRQREQERQKEELRRQQMQPPSKVPPWKKDRPEVRCGVQHPFNSGWCKRMPPNC
jgi:hypothetical protein